MQARKGPLRVYSWNVNGLRACAKKGFAKWLRYSRADIVGLQEVRAEEHQLPEEVRAPTNWHMHFSSAERKGYSGVGLYSRGEAKSIQTSIDNADFDAEGRVQIANFGKLHIANVYFPNGSGKNRDNSRVPFKLDFYRTLFDKLERLRKRGGRVIVMGDFNTAHEAIDIARPKSNEKTSGFLPEEREDFKRFIDDGWVDTFRHLHPDAADRYTWWSQRFGVRERNVGWRIDYMLASEGAMKFVQHAQIHPNVKGSDHCPISLELDRAVLDGAKSKR